MIHRTEQPQSLSLQFKFDLQKESLKPHEKNLHTASENLLQGKLPFHHLYNQIKLPFFVVVSVSCVGARCDCEQTLQLPAEQQRGGGGGVHQPGGVPDAGGAAAEQGRRRLPRQHPVAEELLAPRLN